MQVQTVHVHLKCFVDDLDANSIRKLVNKLCEIHSGYCSIFAKNVLCIENPRVGVLNIGEEAGKGNELVQTTYKMLEENKDGLNFIGNVEGKELFHGDCNVVVCDGFSGNIFLKGTEGMALAIMKQFKKKLIRCSQNSFISVFCMSIFKHICIIPFFS